MKRPLFSVLVLIGICACVVSLLPRASSIQGIYLGMTIEEAKGILAKGPFESVIPGIEYSEPTIRYSEDGLIRHISGEYAFRNGGVIKMNDKFQDVIQAFPNGTHILLPEMHRKPDRSDVHSKLVYPDGLRIYFVNEIVRWVEIGEFSRELTRRDPAY